MKAKFHLKITARDSGFTLIELLASVLIVAVLAALLLGGFQKVKGSGERAKCASNLRQLGTAIMAYVAENDGYLPPGNRDGVDGGNITVLLSQYTSPMIYPTMASDVFYCPTNVRLKSPPAGGYNKGAWGHYKGFSGYWSNFTINRDIFPISSSDPQSGVYAANGRVRAAAVIMPGKTVALADMYTRPPEVNNPAIPYLRDPNNFDPKHKSFFLGRIHNNLGNVLFLDGHVESFGGSEKMAVKSIPDQTTTWW